MNKMITSLTLAASLFAAVGTVQAQGVAPMAANPPPELVTNGPQASPGDNSASARQNVAESRQYEQLLQRNAGFRSARIRKECGPIDNPELHQQCVASFQGGS